MNKPALDLKAKALLDIREKRKLNSKNEFTQSLAVNIVSDLILPAVKWQAGRKNEAIRILNPFNSL